MTNLLHSYSRKFGKYEKGERRQNNAQDLTIEDCHHSFSFRPISFSFYIYYYFLKPKTYVRLVEKSMNIKGLLKANITFLLRFALLSALFPGGPI